MTDFILYFSLATSSAAIVAILLVIFKGGRWVGRIEGDIKKIFGILEGIDRRFRGVDKRLDGIDAKIDERDRRFTEFSRRTEGDIKELRQDVKVMMTRVLALPVGKNSPLHLTDIGERMSKDISGRAWATDVAHALRHKIEGKEPYEIHEFSFQYVKKELEPDPDLASKIGRCAYETGYSRDDVLDVMAIELRDALMRLAGLSTATAPPSS